MTTIDQSALSRTRTARKFCDEGQAGGLQARQPGRVCTLVSRQKDTAMSADYLPKITPRDLNILEDMLDHSHRDDHRLANAIRRKLRLAQIIFADDLPASIVTLGSRIAFQVDERPIEERTLVTAEQYVPGQAHQSIASLRGIAMLGLAEGNYVEVELEDRTETLAVIQVLYQPEAERRGRKAPTGLRLVSSGEGAMRTTRSVRDSNPLDDDPGPSAA